MPGQKMSEKWWRRTRRLRSRVGAISFRRSYSRGTCNATHQRDELEKEMGLIAVTIFVEENCRKSGSQRTVAVQTEKAPLAGQGLYVLLIHAIVKQKPKQFLQ